MSALPFFLQQSSQFSGNLEPLCEIFLFKYAGNLIKAKPHNPPNVPSIATLSDA